MQDKIADLMNNNEIRQSLQLNEVQFQGTVALAYNMYEQGKMHEAETLFGGLSVINPQSYYGFAGLGAIALAKRPPDLDSAFKNLSTAEQLNPNDTSVQANLGAHSSKIKNAASLLEAPFEPFNFHWDMCVLHRDSSSVGAPAGARGGTAISP